MHQIFEGCIVIILDVSPRPQHFDLKKFKHIVQELYFCSN